MVGLERCELKSSKRDFRKNRFSQENLCRAKGVTKISVNMCWRPRRTRTTTDDDSTFFITAFVFPINSKFIEPVSTWYLYPAWYLIPAECPNHKVVADNYEHLDRLFVFIECTVRIHNEAHD